MKIWADTINDAFIKSLLPLGILHGITTNPELLSKAIGKKLSTTLEKLLGLQRGPLAVQVVGESAEEMIKEGVELHSFSTHIIVKLPVTFEGLKALHALSRQGIATMATAVFEPTQALLALNAGAAYIAPYFGRILKIGQNPLDVIGKIKLLQQDSFPETRLLVAGLKTLEPLNDLIGIGVDGVTLRESLLDKLLQIHPATAEACQDFAKAWGTPLTLNLSEIRT